VPKYDALETPWMMKYTLNEKWCSCRTEYITQRCYFFIRHLTVPGKIRRMHQMRLYVSLYLPLCMDMCKSTVSTLMKTINLQH